MNHCQTLKRIATASVLFGLSIVLSSAQQKEAGQIRGHVADVTGALIRGASIFIHKSSPYVDNDKVELAAHTDSEGNFVLSLPEGEYDIIVASAGFGTEMQSVPVFSGKTKMVQWKLKPLACDVPGVICDRFFQ